MFPTELQWRHAFIQPLALLCVVMARTDASSLWSFVDLILFERSMDRSDFSSFVIPSTLVARTTFRGETGGNLYNILRSLGFQYRMPLSVVPAPIQLVQTQEGAGRDPLCNTASFVPPQVSQARCTVFEGLESRYVAPYATWRGRCAESVFHAGLRVIQVL